MVVSSEYVWRRFGVELRKFREHAGMTQGQLARAVPMSQSQVSALERGARGTTPEQIRRFDQVLTTGGALLRRWEDARNQHGYAAWSLGTVELEQTATEILINAPLLVPGLLQTEEYARAVIRHGDRSATDAEVAEQVRARIERQGILRSERGAVVTVVLDETVLFRPIGGHDVLKEQLGALVEAATLPRVTVQVVPAITEVHPGLDGAFHLYTGPNHGTVLYTETRIAGYPVDDPVGVGEYIRLFGELRGVALPPTATLKILKERIGDEV